MKYALPFGTLPRHRRRCVRRLGHADRGLVLRVLSVNLQAYALLAHTAMIAVLIGVIVFAGLRFLSAARRNRAQQTRRR